MLMLLVESGNFFLKIHSLSAQLTGALPGLFTMVIFALSPSRCKNEVPERDLEALASFMSLKMKTFSRALSNSVNFLLVISLSPS